MGMGSKQKILEGFVKRRFGNRFVNIQFYLALAITKEAQEDRNSGHANLDLIEKKVQGWLQFKL